VTLILVANKGARCRKQLATWPGAMTPEGEGRGTGATYSVSRESGWGGEVEGGGKAAVYRRTIGFLKGDSARGEGKVILAQAAKKKKIRSGL